MSSDDKTEKLPLEDSAKRLRELTDSSYALEIRLQQFEKQAAGIEEQVAALDQKLDKRLRDTRPIWEGVLAEVQAIKGKIELLIQDNFEMRATYHALQMRIESLEAGR
jgi:flagellar motility protein MotE (MotC chaperone)